MKLVSLIIPAYNEVDCIRTTLDQACGYFIGRGMSSELIVAADGNDGTREAALDVARGYRNLTTRIHVIGSSERRGKGLAIREAVRLAAGDVIGFTDADNKTPITEFDKIESRLLEGFDVVIGSRSLPDSQIERMQPLYRRMGSKGFDVVKRLCIGLDDISDTQCGFKFFVADVARDLFRRQTIDGYMFDAEILFIARQLGYRIAQVPVRWRDDGDSRSQVVFGAFRILSDTLAIRRRHRSLRPENQPQAISPVDW
jgi:dolichyl-phosphate beta-glucosyltransferase